MFIHCTVHFDLWIEKVTHHLLRLRHSIYFGNLKTFCFHSLFVNPFCFQRACIFYFSVLTTGWLMIPFITQFIRIIVHSPLLFNEINFGRCFEKKSHFLCQNDLHLVKSQSSNNRSCWRFRDRIKCIFFADVCVSNSDRLYICLDYKMFIVVLMS